MRQAAPADDGAAPAPGADDGDRDRAAGAAGHGVAPGADDGDRVVNTATACGFTPQFEGLEALYRERRAEGFVVLGFPANDFAGQEPRSDREIAEFCRANYGVTFPMFAKSVVTGERATRSSGASARRRARRSGTSTSTSSTAVGGSWRGSARAPSRTPLSSSSGSGGCCDGVRTGTDCRDEVALATRGRRSPRHAAYEVERGRAIEEMHGL